MAAHFTILFFENPPCRPPAGMPTLALALVRARQALAGSSHPARAQVVASDGRLWEMAVDAHGVVIDTEGDPQALAAPKGCPRTDRR